MAQEEEQDLDAIDVDINKNFTMQTSFGSFEVLYLIERYIYEVVFPALTNYFGLRLPIKANQVEFFKEFMEQIKKALTFVAKPSHKKLALELVKVIKKVPQLKDVGSESYTTKGLTDEGDEKKKKQGGAISFPQLS